MTLKNLRTISRIQYNAYKLKTGGQIPPVLFIAICKLNKQSKVEDIQLLMDLADHMLRVKGYYFRHKDITAQMDKEVEKVCLERGLL